MQTEEKKDLVEFTEKAPFTIAKIYNDDLGHDEYHVLFGQYRLTDQKLNSIEDALKWTENITWEKIIQLVGIFMKEFKDKDLFINNSKTENNE